MTSNRFDPRPNAPYGVSIGGEVLATQAEADRYLQERKGMPITVTNPTRQMRIEDFVGRKIDHGLEVAMRSIYHAFSEGDATEQEIRKALRVIELDIGLEDLFDDWMDEE